MTRAHAMSGWVCTQAAHPVVLGGPLARQQHVAPADAPGLRRPQDDAQVIRNGIEDPGLQASLGLLIDRFPRGEVMGISRHGAPAHTSRRRPLNPSRRLGKRWGASAVINVK